MSFLSNVGLNLRHRDFH